MKYICYVMVWVVMFMSGGALFWTSTRVQAAVDDNSRLQHELARQDGDIKILRAEWHYLNNPGYLEQMAAMVLDQDSEQDESINTIMASGVNLPEAFIEALPVSKPNQDKSVQKTKPVLVAKAKTTHPVTKIPQKLVSRDFSIVLAGLTQ